MAYTNDKTTNSPDTSIRNKNDNTSRVAYISQKTQRIAGALYALTRSFPSDEPLREALRNQALSLVTSAHTLAGGTPAKDEEAALPALLNQLASQLAVAKDGGLISEMNFSVLREEITRFLGEIREIGAFPGPFLEDDFFSEETPTLSAGEGRNTTPTHSSIMSEPQGRESQPNSQAKNTSRSSERKLSAKDKRRKQILDLFDDKQEITVNDVTDVINGYSTKTIQRDLKALVKNGQLEKHGKRRWTSYTRA